MSLTGVDFSVRLGVVRERKAPEPIVRSLFRETLTPNHAISSGVLALSQQPGSPARVVFRV